MYWFVIFIISGVFGLLLFAVPRKHNWWVLVLFGVAPLLAAGLAQGVAALLGCRVTEANAFGCVLLGVDLSDAMYGMFVGGLAIVITLPAAIVAAILLAIFSPTSR